MRPALEEVQLAGHARADELRCELGALGGVGYRVLCVVPDEASRHIGAHVIGKADGSELLLGCLVGAEQGARLHAHELLAVVLGEAQHAIAREHGIAEQDARGLGGLCVGSRTREQLLVIEALRKRAYQVRSCREAHHVHPVCIHLELVCMPPYPCHRLHGIDNRLGQMRVLVEARLVGARRLPVVPKVGGVVQDEDLESHARKTRRCRLGLTVGERQVRTARADDEGGASLLSARGDGGLELEAYQFARAVLPEGYLVQFHSGSPNRG